MQTDETGTKEDEEKTDITGAGCTKAERDQGGEKPRSRARWRETHVNIDVEESSGEGESEVRTDEAGGEEKKRRDIKGERNHKAERHEERER